MMWGYWQPIEETVVTVTVRQNSELAYASHVTPNGDGNKAEVNIIRSPPLGLPLAAMDDMQTKYSSYVQQIVADDLSSYVSVAYQRPHNRPGLPDCLLQTIANFYSAAIAAGDKV
jgi:hypothetical protein